MSDEEPTGRYGIVAYRPRPRRRERPNGAWRPVVRPLVLAALLWLAWAMGRDAGRAEAARSPAAPCIAAPAGP